MTQVRLLVEAMLESEVHALQPQVLSLVKAAKLLNTWVVRSLAARNPSRHNRRFLRHNRRSPQHNRRFLRNNRRFPHHNRRFLRHMPCQGLQNA